MLKLEFTSLLTFKGYPSYLLLTHGVDEMTPPHLWLRKYPTPPTTCHFLRKYAICTSSWGYPLLLTLHRCASGGSGSTRVRVAHGCIYLLLTVHTGLFSPTASEHINTALPFSEGCISCMASRLKMSTKKVSRSLAWKDTGSATFWLEDVRFRTEQNNVFGSQKLRLNAATKIFIYRNAHL